MINKMHYSFIFNYKERL